MPKPHSREWYAKLGQERGEYQQAWNRVLCGPDPELLFEALLYAHLRPETRVLEAGCGHGSDAARFAGECARWAAYDFIPEFLNTARKNAPQAEFCLWNGKGEIPAELAGPFDLIVSRRGPTSVILRLPELAAPRAQFLYVGPRLEVPQVPERLMQVRWEMLSQARVSVQAFAPTWADWLVRCEHMQEPGVPEDWKAEWEAYATAQGMPYTEERYVVLAGLANKERE